ncbi:MAG: hypothetical protein ABFS34_01715 [Gemmatimonadota bacterium]
MGRTKAGWVAAAVALGLMLGVSEGAAQSWLFDLGVNGGGTFFTKSLTDGDELTLSEDAESGFAAGWLLGAQATVWPSPRFGIRANGAFTERSLQRKEPFSGGDDVQIDDVNIWPFTGDILYRLTEPNETWQGSEFLPYIAVGAGVSSINPAANTSRTIEGEAETGATFDPSGSQRLFLAEKSALTVLAGLGGDLRFSETGFLRLEVGDRLIFDPPFYTDPAGTDKVGDLTHMLYGQAGLHVALGLRAPAQIVMAPPPPRPPAAPPPPPPPPPPARPIQVCVVDPSAANGLEMIDALARVVERDTVVVSDGNEVALATVLPAEVMLAPDADWYVQGQPLVLNFRRAPRRVEFVTTGGSRVIAADDLTLLGMQGGVPVFASGADVLEMSEMLAEQREAMNEGDMASVLESSRALRNAFRDVDIIYVPLQPTGCVFQALQRQEVTLKK